ncbi:hypothetical protein SAMN04488498_12926 [Mesorhizobium albiziae]|uniref:Uncharacterized protein n=1 Tax=Neomesorhizobium albiziae TaxID=335020 RepID=A0A1I4EPW2_9HYPH|nr:hypothetical protein GCM10007937_24950 [Mesorhizobium albiziae]SFL07724.1 hypothetical protein SAMN04488498_12926 [Mesorhizobium albiziae]
MAKNSYTLVTQFTAEIWGNLKPAALGRKDGEPKTHEQRSGSFLHCTFVDTAFS